MQKKSMVAVNLLLIEASGNESRLKESLVPRVINGKKSSTRLQYPCLSPGQSIKHRRLLSFRNSFRMLCHNR